MLRFLKSPRAVRQTIYFDDLFADELAYLETHHGQKNVKRSQSLAFFQRYAGQPVLDKAMQNIASATDQQVPAENWLMDAADCFMSFGFAQRFGKFIMKIMNKVSPRYSNSTWWIAGIISTLLIFFFTENRFENESLPVFSTLHTGLVFWLFISIPAALISSAIVRFQRRRIPTTYWQPMRNSEPFILIGMLGLFLWLIAAVYGYFAGRAVPSWHNAPLNTIRPITQILTDRPCQNATFRSWTGGLCLLNNDNHTLRNVVSKPAVSPIASTQPVNTSKPPVSQMSIEDKLRYIQQRLKDSGYPIKVDGQYGKKTQQYALEYLKKHGIAAPNPVNINSLYKAMQTL